MRLLDDKDQYIRKYPATYPLHLVDDCQTSLPFYRGRSYTGAYVPSCCVNVIDCRGLDISSRLDPSQFMIFFFLTEEGTLPAFRVTGDI